MRFAVAVAIPALALAAPAGADPAVPLGGGSGIVVDGSHCTQTTIGHDKTGELVGFTAAHCGGPGAQVVAEGAEDHGALGAVVAANGDLDYAVIRFDPAKVTPVANVAGFAIRGLGPDPDQGQPTCTLGAATGNYCSHTVSVPGPGSAIATLGPFQPGDDGGPVTADGLLVGLVFRGFVIPGDLLGNLPIPETDMVKFSKILDDVNANGGPGAGFTPIPG